MDGIDFHHLLHLPSLWAGRRVPNNSLGRRCFRRDRVPAAGAAATEVQGLNGAFAGRESEPRGCLRALRPVVMLPKSGTPLSRNGTRHRFCRLRWGGNKLSSRPKMNLPEESPSCFSSLEVSAMVQNEGRFWLAGQLKFDFEFCRASVVNHKETVGGIR